jgi:Leucine-rich repeat (LRR) protein
MRRLMRPLGLLLLIALTITACTDVPVISLEADDEQPEAAPSGDLPPPEARGASTVGEPPVPVAPPASAAGESAQPSPDALSAGEVLLPDPDRERPSGDDRADGAAAAAADPPVSADSTDCTEVTEIPEAECEALVALYDSTGGDTWDDNTNWKQNNEPCTSPWYGVACSGNHVSELILGSNNLVGSIPPQLGSLSNLVHLHLGDNQLSGSIPPELGGLSNLEDLVLYINQLSGSIPPQLGNLSNLGALYLWNNQLSGSIPPKLGDLSNLWDLNLSYNQLSGAIPPKLGNLPNLEQLHLDHNRLSGSIPPALGNLPNLWWLDLDNNALSGDVPPALANLTTLSDLNLGYNALTASDPTLLTFLSSKDPDWADTQTVAPDDLAVTGADFESITLSWTPILYTGDGGYYEVGYAPSAGGPYTVHGTTADKSASGYTVDGLAPETTYYFRVRTFTPAHGDQQNDLWSGYTTAIPGTPGCAAVTEIPQAECEALVALYDSTDGPGWWSNINWKQNDQPCTWDGVACSEAHVSELNLASNNLSGAIPPELGGLSNLQGLSLSGNQLSGAIPPELGGLSELQSLSLGNNQLSGGIPPELGDLSNLEYLYLTLNQLSGAIPPELGDLSNLEILALYSNQLSGAIPPELGDLSNLVWLFLDRNQLSGAIPPELGGLSNLEILYLWDNQLSGSIPPELGGLSNLARIDLKSNQLSGSIPPELGGLSNLWYLGLSYNQLSGSIPPELADLSGLWELDLGYNMLTATGDPPLSFLNSKDPDWADTQTVAPDGLAVVSVGSGSVELSWTPITYTGNGGYYEIGISTSAGGPFVVVASTANKSASGGTAIKLSPETTYYLAVRTFTPAHDAQQNDLWSDFSAPVSAKTPAVYSPAAVESVDDVTFVGPSGGPYQIEVTLTMLVPICGGRTQIEQWRDGSTAYVEITRKKPRGGSCAPSMKQVELVLVLDGTFDASTTWTINVNGYELVVDVPS